MSERANALKAWPVDIKVQCAEKNVVISFDDGCTFTYTAEYLRVESPSAESRGHGSTQTHVIAGRKHVGIKTVEPVGNYAVRICFDDNHDTGIYSWNYLYELGEKWQDNWQRYIQRLQSLGLTRDPQT